MLATTYDIASTLAGPDFNRLLLRARQDSDAPLSPLVGFAP